MKAVIPIPHPTWVGATYAAGPGWVVADARNLTAKPAETGGTPAGRRGDVRGPVREALSRPVSGLDLEHLIQAADP
jgi:hypothetical protein